VHNAASASVDSRLFVNISDTEGGGIACSVFHNEDDSPREGWYYATDSGNGYTSIWGLTEWVPTFVLSRAGDSAVVLPANVSLDVLCY
jgi:hypothetical protein